MTSQRDDAPWTTAPDGRIMHFGIQHIVSKTRTWTSQHAVTFTDWEARCGVAGTQTGDARSLHHRGTYDRIRLAACKTCEA